MLIKRAKSIKEQMAELAMPYANNMPEFIKKPVYRTKAEESIKRNLDYIKHLGLYGGGTTAATLGLMPIAMPSKHKAKTEFKGTAQRIRKYEEMSKLERNLVRSFAKKHKVNPQMTIGKMDPLLKLQTGGAAFHPKMGIKSNIKSSPILLHELGHAVDFKNFANLKGGLRGLGMAGMVAAPFMGMHEDLKKYAPAAWFGSMLPTLYQEGKASGLALKHMYDIGKKTGIGGKEILRGLKSLGPAFLTYLLTATIPAIGLHQWAKKD
ncbi:MAG: hypothetical protein ACTSPI_00170 [Candidatus Heimdallarchaeaceae archaeon]